MIAKLEWMLTKETPGKYGSRNRFVYEVVLRTSNEKAWLKTPEDAQRCFQTLLRVQRSLQLEWLDILMWQDGLYLRLKLGNASNLLEVLSLFRDESSLASAPETPPWEKEPTWVRMVTPERAQDSGKLFREKFVSLMEALRQKPGASETLFFYHF